MSRPTKSSDVIEIHWEHAFSYGGVGLGCIGLFGLLYYYRGGGTLIYAAYIILFIGICTLGYGLKRALEVRDVTGVSYTCPYCGGYTELTEIASADFTCQECNRLIPIIDGEIIPVEQVRCGYCNALNYYSEKSEFLICEKCNRESPIHSEGEGKAVATYYVLDDDDAPYELVLDNGGPKTEEVVDVLQKMLALNRNQVKQILEDTPQVLLTGIPKRKAVILQAQLETHDAKASYRPVV
jgi:uncharacterized protein YbaR (Trm112 family)